MKTGMAVSTFSTVVPISATSLTCTPGIFIFMARFSTRGDGRRKYHVIDRQRGTKLHRVLPRRKARFWGGCNGAPRRNRTADPIITNDVLYQLSYRGTARVLGERPNPRKRPSAETQR